MKLKFSDSTYDWRDFRVGGRVLQIIRLDSCDPFPVIFDFRPGLNQRVEHDVAVEVDDRDSSEPVTFLGQNAFAIQCQNLCLPTSVITVKICHKLNLNLSGQNEVAAAIKLTCPA